MGLNDTPLGNRIHIGFFGRRNAGKSSLVNAVTGQELSVVSDMKGTTTDPVYKAMELLPLGPVVIIDTPGIDDEGTLGELRIRKTKQVLNKSDIAVLVVDGTETITSVDKELLTLFREKEVPYLVVYNKVDVVDTKKTGKKRQSPEDDSFQDKEIAQNAKYDFFQNKVIAQNEKDDTIRVSALKHEGIYELKERLAHLIPAEKDQIPLVRDLIHPMDLVVLVVPIDSAAPKGRLILPQQQVIRDVLEAGAVSVVVRDTELKQTLDQLGKKPYMVITDSQVFEQVAKDTPEDIFLTSFSILMARKKGFLTTAVESVSALERLQDGDRILIAEGCTHHRQCDDIGTVKIPNWIRSYTGKNPQFEYCSGTEFPEDLSGYKLVIHCGACMLGDKEVHYRMKCAKDQGVPFTNYGTVIAHMKGILKRSVEIIPKMLDI